MKNQVFENLLSDLVLFSQIQEKLSCSIENRDAKTVLALNSEGCNLLHRLPPQLTSLKKAVSDLNSRQAITLKDVQSLIQWVEKSQAWVLGNQVELGKWKDTLAIKLWEASVEGVEGTKPEGQNFVKEKNAQKPNLNSSKFSSQGKVLGKPVWESQSPQTKIGERFDRLT